MASPASSPRHGANLENSLVSKASHATGGSAALNFMRELDKINKESIDCAQKTEIERGKSQQLDIEIEVARRELKEFQARTRNGEINKVNDLLFRKKISKLETELQKAKIALSVAKSSNIKLKKEIDDMRRAKALSVDILFTMENEIASLKTQVTAIQKESVVVNEKRQRAKLQESNIKHKMIKDMEEFSSNLNQAKRTMAESQEGIMDTIREKMRTTVLNMTLASKIVKKIERLDNLKDGNDDSLNEQGEIAQMLRELGLNSLKELYSAVTQAEEQMFILYHEVQDKNKEMEKLEAENKALESKLELKLAEVNKLEVSNDKVRQELEQHIASIQKAIAKFDREYAVHMDVLNSISDSLLSVLKFIASDEAALDQNLLPTGVTDRNIDDFLGLIEQRIDDLIQLHKASLHQPLRKDDFVKIPNAERVGLIQVPNLPSLSETIADNDNDDDDENVRIQPVSISALKESMMKKMQRNLEKVSTTGKSDAFGGDAVSSNKSPMKGKGK